MILIMMANVMKILGGLAVLSLNLQDLLIKCWCWVGQDSIKYWEWLSHYCFATTSLTKYKKHFWKFLNGLDTDLDCLVFYHKRPLSHHSEKCVFTIASNLPNLCICIWYVYTLSQKILYTLTLPVFFLRNCVRFCCRNLKLLGRENVPLRSQWGVLRVVPLRKLRGGDGTK